MITFTAFLDIFTLIAYFKTGKDFIGVETAKLEFTKVLDHTSRTILQKIHHAIVVKAQKVPFYLKIALLSLEFNPFMVTALLRTEPITNKKIDKTDWKIFTLSFFIGNLYWAIILTGALTIIREAFQYLFSLL